MAYHGSCSYRNGSLELFAQLKLGNQDLHLLIHGGLHLLAAVQATLQCTVAALLERPCKMSAVSAYNGDAAQ